jgi:hypothetical protein
MIKKEEDMNKGNRNSGWIPDSDNPDNDYIRSLLLEAKIKKLKGKVPILKKKIKKAGK